MITYPHLMRKILSISQNNMEFDNKVSRYYQNKKYIYFTQLPFSSGGNMQKKKRAKSIYKTLHSFDTEEAEPMDFIAYLRGLDSLTPAEALFIRR